MANNANNVGVPLAAGILMTGFSVLYALNNWTKESPSQSHFGSAQSQLLNATMIGEPCTAWAPKPLDFAVVVLGAAGVSLMGYAVWNGCGQLKRKVDGVLTRAYNNNSSVARIVGISLAVGFAVHLTSAFLNYVGIKVPDASIPATLITGLGGLRYVGRPAAAGDGRVPFGGGEEIRPVVRAPARRGAADSDSDISDSDSDAAGPAFGVRRRAGMAGPAHARVPAAAPIEFFSRNINDMGGQPNLQVEISGRQYKFLCALAAFYAALHANTLSDGEIRALGTLTHAATAAEARRKRWNEGLEDRPNLLRELLLRQVALSNKDRLGSIAHTIANSADFNNYDAH